VNSQEAVRPPRFERELLSQTFLNLLEARHIRGAAFRIALFIYEQTACAERTSCPLSARKIAKKTHYSKVTVSMSLKKLEQTKIVWIEIPSQDHYTTPRIIHLGDDVIATCRQQGLDSAEKN